MAELLFRLLVLLLADCLGSREQTDRTVLILSAAALATGNDTPQTMSLSSLFSLGAVFVLAQLALFGGATLTSAFLVTLPLPSVPSLRIISIDSSALFARSKKNKDNSWLQEFSIASGEIIDPYAVLKVARSASRSDIRQQYIQLSRRYHPDSTRMRNSDILPGNCNNMDEVRDQWERIKLSYEILTDPKRRKKFDRHSMIADPGEAVKRAAIDAALSGVTGVGKGIFNMGVFAVRSIANNAQIANEQRNATTDKNVNP